MNDLRKQAIAILRQNDRGGFTVPTDGLYPFQWNWDSAFAAMGFSTFDTSRALTEIEFLLRGQWADGMVPHIVFHDEDPRYFPGPEVWGVTHVPRTSGITQPPILATALRRMAARASQARLSAIFPKVLAWHRWYHAARDPAGTGMVAVHHPWETGRDNSPSWDLPLARVPVDDLPPYQRRDLGHVNAAERPHAAEYDRYLTLLYRFRARGYDPQALYAESPFRVADVGITALMLRADRDLLALAETLGIEDGRAELARWIELGEGGLERLWNDQVGGYRSRDLVTGRSIPVGTSADFWPLFATRLPAARVERSIATLARWLEAVRFGVPSTDPADPGFEPRRYWRGPVWLMVNWMIAEGLEEHGAGDLAERLNRDSRTLIQQSGFCEYYHPMTGAGCGGESFTFTAATALFWPLVDCL